MNNMRRRAVFTCAVGVLLALGIAAAQTESGASDARTGSAPVSIALGTAIAPNVEQDEGYRFSRPILRVGQDLTLRAGEVAREAMSVFGDITLEGRVDDNVVAVLGSVHARSTAVVEGSLIVIGGTATIDQGAAIHRDLVVLGGTLQAPPGYSSGGDQVVVGSPAVGAALASLMPWLTRGLLWGRLIVPGLGWVWAIVAVAFLIYLGINTLFDWPVRRSADAIVERPISTVLLGLLVLVLTVPAIAILAATVIGLAVVPFVLCALFVAGLVGKAGVARAIGRTLVRQSSPESRLQSLRSFVLGSVVIFAAYMVPVVGIAVWAFTSVIGVGASAVMLMAALRREHPPRERVVTPPPRAGVPEDQRQSVVAPDMAQAHVAPPAASIVGEGALFPRATFFDRVAAFALDCLLVAIAVQILDLPRYDPSFGLALLVYYVAFWAWRGTTLGGIVVGLRVVRTQGGELRFVEALVRGLASIFSIAALGIGCFWMVQDPERQMWHDKIAGTLVVRVPRNLLLA